MNNLTLPEMIANLPVLFTFSGYTVKKMGPNDVWFEAPSGEGTQMPKAKLREWFDRILNEEM